MMKFLSRLTDTNEREVRALEPFVAQINALEPELQALTDTELAAWTETLRARLADEIGDILTPIELRELDPDEEAAESALAGADAARLADELKQQRDRELKRINDALEGVLPEAFAAVREAMVRALGKRHYDVQLMGGIVLHRGAIAEQRTGEGKTFVGPLAAYLNALVGRGVHVVTVNDYLAKRDAQWIGAVFHRLGMSVGSIQHEGAFVFDPDFPATDERLRDLRPVTRQEAYAADVTYGTNNELGFDFLRDNLVVDLRQRVQRAHFFAIVDEVDNILIDEARTPLIISGNAEQSADKYVQFAGLVPRLKAEEDYIVDEKFKQVAITEAGTDKMERLARRREHVRRRLQPGPPPGAGAEGTGPLPARPRLRGEGRRGGHRRRVHRAPHARAPMVRRASTRPWRPRRGSPSDPSSGPWPRSPSRTTSGCTRSWPG